MPRRTLTAITLDRIKPPSQGQLDYFDQGYPGLALRVSYGGTRTWVYFYRAHAKVRRATLGRYPSMSLAEAREAWRKAREALARGEVPTVQRDPRVDLFENVADEWLRRDQAHKRSFDEVKRIIDRDVIPHWRGRPIDTIKKRDVIEVVERVADRGAVVLARRLHAHVHRLFRWAVSRDIIESNPAAELQKPGAIVRRERVLSDDELALVWNAAVDWPFGAIVRLLILTGARRDEIGALRWSELQGDKIELAGARTKNSEPRTIPLSPLAQDIIKALPRLVGSEFVFTTIGKSSVSGWSKAKTRLDKALGDHVAPWRLHDLRRTIATGMQRMGVNLQVVEAILGHVSGSRAGVVGVYQRYAYEPEKKAALDLWANHVAKLVGANVIDLRTQA